MTDFGKTSDSSTILVKTSVTETSLDFGDCKKNGICMPRYGLFQTVYSSFQYIDTQKDKY